MTTIAPRLDADARDLVVEALRSDSIRRQRAATRAAAELDAEKRGGRRDIRSGAVMVTNLLVDAARLDDAANAIAAAEEVETSTDRHPSGGSFTMVVTGSGGSGVDNPPAVRLLAVPDPEDVPEGLDDEVVQDDDRAGEVRTRAEALADTAKVIADLGLNITRADLDTDLDDLDVPLPEDSEDLDDDVGALDDLVTTPTNPE